MGGALPGGGFSDFKASAHRLSAACALDGGEEPPRRDHETVQSALLIILFSRFSFLGEAELCDIADEAIGRLVHESRRQGRVLDNAAGWLRKVTINIAIDRLRSQAHESLSDYPETAEDDIATRLLDRIVTDDQVRHGLKKAIEEGDEMVVRVVGDWLDLAREFGYCPSSRTVAERCGYSHTTVQAALRRFSRYLT